MATHKVKACYSAISTLCSRNTETGHLSSDYPPLEPTSLRNGLINLLNSGATTMVPHRVKGYNAEESTTAAAHDPRIDPTSMLQHQT